MLYLGGNDQHERGEGGAPFGGADALLASDPGGALSLVAGGWECVMVAGHPEGHPGLGFDVEKTAELLERKVRDLLTTGVGTVGVVSQLCFDTPTLLRWLGATRTALARVAEDTSVPVRKS